MKEKKPKEKILECGLKFRWYFVILFIYGVILPIKPSLFFDRFIVSYGITGAYEFFRNNTLAFIFHPILIMLLINIMILIRYKIKNKKSTI